MELIKTLKHKGKEWMIFQDDEYLYFKADGISKRISHQDFGKLAGAFMVSPSRIRDAEELLEMVDG